MNNDLLGIPDIRYRKENGRHLIYAMAGIGLIVWNKEKQEEEETLSTVEEADKFLADVGPGQVGVERMAAIQAVFDKHYGSLLAYSKLPMNQGLLNLPEHAGEVDLYVGKDERQIVLFDLGHLIGSLANNNGKLIALRDARGRAICSFPVKTWEDFWDRFAQGVEKSDDDDVILDIEKVRRPLSQAYAWVGGDLERAASTGDFELTNLVVIETILDQNLHIQCCEGNKGPQLDAAMAAEAEIKRAMDKFGVDEMLRLLAEKIHLV